MGKFETSAYVPDNCNNQNIREASLCKAVHRSNPECDCRWCVFNKYFNKKAQ